MIYAFTPTFQEDAGRWSAWIEDLPGCATWGYSKKGDALQALHDAAVLVLEDMIECGEDIPAGRGSLQVVVPA